MRRHSASISTRIAGVTLRPMNGASAIWSARSSSFAARLADVGVNEHHGTERTSLVGAWKRRSYTNGTGPE